MKKDWWTVHQEHCMYSLWLELMLPLRVQGHSFTFLKTMASSSQTGLMALPWEVLVLNAFLFVSTGKPNMSISTYVPTFLSDRNWPEMIWKEKCNYTERKLHTHTYTHKTQTHLHRQCVGYYPIHCALSKWVKVLIRPSHKLWFQSVATFPIVLIHAQVELHW